jgi:hypothetical protein
MLAADKSNWGLIAGGRPVPLAPAAARRKSFDRRDFQQALHRLPSYRPRSMADDFGKHKDRPRAIFLYRFSEKIRPREKLVRAVSCDKP